MQRDRTLDCVSVCVPSLLESAIVFDTCVTVCGVCMYVCVCARECVYMCAYVCTEGQSYGTLLLATCTYVQSGCI